MRPIVAGQSMPPSQRPAKIPASNCPNTHCVHPLGAARISTPAHQIYPPSIGLGAAIVEAGFDSDIGGDVPDWDNTESRESDEDAAWRDLVARFEEPATTTGPTPWPDRENVSGSRPPSARPTDGTAGAPGTHGAGGAHGADGAEEPPEDRGSRRTRADGEARGDRGTQGDPGAFEDTGARGDPGTGARGDPGTGARGDPGTGARGDPGAF